MIFYFSGTGNSLYVAKNVKQNDNDKLISIADVMNSKDGCFEYDLEKNETIGFVYPIHAWGPPEMVIKFIEKLKLNNYKKNYIFTIATCAKNIGNAVKVIDNSLEKKNLHLNSGFSVVMPNNFIILADVDTKEVQKEKLSKVEKTLEDINNVIKAKKDDIRQVEKGSMCIALTYIANPIFNKKGVNTKKFHVSDECTGCGLCESVCNSGTIKLKDNKPVWGNECALCLACVHLCPVKAIQYGNKTEQKGRYKNPNVDVNELKKNITK